jgi:hypothetical protein
MWLARPIAFSRRVKLDLIARILGADFLREGRFAAINSKTGSIFCQTMATRAKPKDGAVCLQLLFSVFSLNLV